MKILLSITLLFCTFLVSAESDKTVANKKFSFGLSFSPDYAFRVLSASEDNKQFVGDRNEIDKPIIGFTTGLTV